MQYEKQILRSARNFRPQVPLKGTVAQCPLASCLKREVCLAHSNRSVLYSKTEVPTATDRPLG
jgi:hypothetical protein